MNAKNSPAVLGPVEPPVRPLAQKLRDAASQAADEIERLRGERDVYVRWVRNALLLLETIDTDEQEDGGEYHRMFMEHGTDLVTHNVAVSGELSDEGYEKA